MYLYYVSCLRYTILVGNPRYYPRLSVFQTLNHTLTGKSKTVFMQQGASACHKTPTQPVPKMETAQCPCSLCLNSNTYRTTSGKSTSILYCLLDACLKSRQQARIPWKQSARVIVRTATLRQKLWIKFSVSPSHSTRDTRPTNPSNDPETPNGWQGSHHSTNL